MRRLSGGFTLVELLVAVVLLAIIGQVTVRLLTGSQRITRSQRERIALQASVRGGALLVPAELRELGSSGGSSDILAFGRDSVTYRAMRSTSVACALTPARITLRRALTFGYRVQSAGRDSVMVFLDGDPVDTLDDVWAAFPITGAPAGGTCPDGSAGTVLPTAIPLALAGRVVLDAPVRTFEVMQLRLYRSGAQYWLGARSVSAGEAQLQPVLGPLAANGFELTMLDANAAPVSGISSVRMIGIMLRGLSETAVSDGASPRAVLADSLTSRIRLRNVPLD